MIHDVWISRKCDARGGRNKSKWSRIGAEEHDGVFIRLRSCISPLHF